MNRRIAYKEQAKCNFCYNWFQVFSQIKFGLNICQDCIYKALNTSCFKFPTPQGQLYQVYLARRHISLQPQTQSLLFQRVDQFMHSQIRSILDKWEEVSQAIFSCLQYKSQSDLLKKTQAILANDAKRFESFKSQTLNQINQDLLGRQRKMLSTPLKDKSLNTSIKYGNKSARKILTRADSKKLLNLQADENQKTKQKMNQEQINVQQLKRSIQCSPSARTSKKGKGINGGQKQNREFVSKMQAIKSNIVSSLQGRGQQIGKSEPVKILKQKIYEAISNTNCINKCIELVSYSGLHNMDINCYLRNLEWQGVDVVKFVKVGLSDDQFKDILQFLDGKNIQTLVLTGNNLTQESCRNLLKSSIQGLRNIYMGKNQIFTLKAKKQIKELKEKYNFYL